MGRKGGTERGKKGRKRGKGEEKWKRNNRERNQGLPQILNLDQSIPQLLILKMPSPPLLQRLVKKASKDFSGSLRTVISFTARSREIYLVRQSVPSWKSLSLHYHFVLSSWAGSERQGGSGIQVPWGGGVVCFLTQRLAPFPKPPRDRLHRGRALGSIQLTSSRGQDRKRLCSASLPSSIPVYSLTTSLWAESPHLSCSHRVPRHSDSMDT